jgi:hypothetical protein
MATTFCGLPHPGVVNQNPPERLRGNGEEMRAVLPRNMLARCEHPQVEFVNQGCGLQRVVRTFLTQVTGSKAP